MTVTVVVVVLRRCAEKIVNMARAKASTQVVEGLSDQAFTMSLGQTVYDPSRYSQLPSNKVFSTGALYERGPSPPITLECNSTGVGVTLSIELALFTVLFPYGKGHFVGTLFSNYLKHRFTQHLSLFTLHKAYIIMMFHLQQIHRLLSSQHK